jgi:hypothetical protein
MRCVVVRALAFWSALVVVSCGADEEATGEHDRTVQSLVNSEADREARQREVDEYNQLKSVGWKIIDTRVSASGQVIDYVSANTLYPDDPDAPFATPPVGVEADEETPETGDIRRGATEIEVEASLRPPPGTIPVLREQFVGYVEDPGSARSLSEYLAQIVEPPANVAANGHLYTSQLSQQDNYETRAYINLWKYGETSFTRDMSLMQGSETCPIAAGLESVEAGFMVQPALFGDENLHLFTFFTRAGHAAAPADYQLSYNKVKKGFVQWNGATTFPGATIASNTLSSVNGLQYECEVRFQLYKGNWWLHVCSNWLGYFPTANSTSVTSTQRIYFGTLSTVACDYSWFGEASTRNWFDFGFWGPVDIGSGRFPSEGFGRAAYIRTPSHRDPFTGVWVDMPNGPKLSGLGYDANCYRVSHWGALGSSPPYNGFFVGGPGYTPGSCQ